MAKALCILAYTSTHFYVHTVAIFLHSSPIMLVNFKEHVWMFVHVCLCIFMYVCFYAFVFMTASRSASRSARCQHIAKVQSLGWRLSALRHSLVDVSFELYSCRNYPVKVKPQVGWGMGSTSVTRELYIFLYIICMHTQNNRYIYLCILYFIYFHLYLFTHIYVWVCMCVHNVLTIAVKLLKIYQNSIILTIENSDVWNRNGNINKIIIQDNCHPRM